MPDDTTTNDVTGTGADAAAQAAEAARQAAEQAAAAAKAAERETIAALSKKVDALVDGFKAAVAPRQAVAPDGTPAKVPPNFRALLRQQGMTDADIDHNAPLIMPFLGALLATEGQGMLAAVQGVKDEVDMVKAARNTRKYPDWNDLEDKIVEARTEAAKNGQYLTVDAAYHAAVAGNLDVVEAGRARRKAASNAHDVTNQDVLRGNQGAHSGATGQRRTALTAEELAALPPAERRKIYDAIGDLPIR